MKHLLVVVALLCMMSIALFCETIISGRVTGYDGKPIIRADVHLTKPLGGKPIVETTVANDGTFSLTTKESGIILLKFTGVNHNPYDVALYVEKPKMIKLDVQMATYHYIDSLAAVDIVGDFNKFNWSSAQHMTKQQDGTFSSEFETKADTFQYQLLNVETTGRSINGTQSDGYKYDGGGDYISIIKSNSGNAKIIFDPSKIVHSNTVAESHILGEDPLNSRFSSIYNETTKRRDVYMKAYDAFKKTGKDTKDFKYNWSASKSDIVSHVQNEKEPILKQFYILSYLDFFMYGDRDLDSTIVRLVFSEISPQSPLWSIKPDLVFPISASKDKEKTEKYTREVEETNPDINVRAYLVMNRMINARFANQLEEYSKLYDKMETEFKDVDQWKSVKQLYPREMKLQVGKRIPDFSFASIDDPTIVHTNKTLLGKVYLIDFWATWCGPCVGEMENLHKAYEKYKSKGLEILSVSFDQKIEDVIKFRKNKWKMPWFNSFVQEGPTSAATKQFEILGIPKPILVDKNGTIVALEGGLRGPGLEKMLEKVLLQ